jgi:hypothetical protein
MALLRQHDMLGRALMHSHGRHRRGDSAGRAESACRKLCHSAVTAVAARMIGIGWAALDRPSGSQRRKNSGTRAHASSNLGCTEPSARSRLYISERRLVPA